MTAPVSGATSASGCRRRAARKRAICASASRESGGREPVNVMDGNYLRAADVCPWWNANVAARKTG